MALMFLPTVWSRALQSAQLIQDLRHKANLTYAVPAVWCFPLVHTEKALLCSLCTTACSLSIFLLLCLNCAWPCRIVQSTCLAAAETQEWERAVKARRRRGVYIHFTLFVCEHHLSIWFSIVTKAPRALLPTGTEQQGAVQAQRAVQWSMAAGAAHLRADRRQAGSVSLPWHSKRACPEGVSCQGWCQMLHGEKLKLWRLTKQSLSTWELIDEDQLNPWTLCLAFFPNYLLVLITTLYIVDGYNLSEVPLNSWTQWLSCVNDFHILVTCEKVFPSFIEVLI